MNNSKSIVVIGAGASGLMAARVLSENNHDVTVVEARDRVGGRIYTSHSVFERPIEAGAEFMHGKQPLTMSLVKESGSRTTLLDGNRYQLSNGNLRKGDFFDDDWQQLTRALQDLKTDTDIASFLNRHFSGKKYDDLRKKVRGFVEGYDAADMNRVSALALRKEWSESDDDHQYHIEGGYSGLMEFLEEKIKTGGGKIVLSTPVTEIHWGEGRAKVVTATGKVLEAEKLVVSLPLGVLQKGVVKFSPAIPDHMASFSEMSFGGVIKFFFAFKRAFWEDHMSRPLQKLAFMFSDAEIPTWWSQLPHETPLLTGWLGGPSARDRNNDPEALFRVATSSLRYILDCSDTEVTHEIARWHVVDWTSDPYASGAYSYPTLKTRQAREFVVKPLKDTLYFCGEHLYDGPAMGTVEAALVNGKQVAEAIANG